MNELSNRISASEHPRATLIRVIHPRHVAANSTADFKIGARFIARSIQEWTKESGIVIASCVYEDDQIVCDRIENANIIAKTPREAQLWLREEKFGENQVLHDVKFYVTHSFFTVKTTGAKDIITSEQIIRDAGEGAGGYILMPSHPTDQVLSLHIKSKKTTRHECLHLRAPNSSGRATLYEIYSKRDKELL
jgi:hypothetical protein